MSTLDESNRGKSRSDLLAARHHGSIRPVHAEVEQCRKNQNFKANKPLRLLLNQEYIGRKLYEMVNVGLR